MQHSLQLTLRLQVQKSLMTGIHTIASAVWLQASEQPSNAKWMALDGAGLQPNTMLCSQQCSLRAVSAVTIPKHAI